MSDPLKTITFLKRTDGSAKAVLLNDRLTKPRIATDFSSLEVTVLNRFGGREANIKNSI